jgi:hypothetical protein
MWKTSLDIFGEGNALFRTSALVSCEKLTDYNLEYGIIPMQKYEETQNSYYSPCATSLAYGICIPTTAPDPEFSAFMIEVMACESKNYLADAYVSTLSKTDEDKEMLEKYILSNIVYEADFIYTQEYSNIIRLMEKKSTDVKAQLDKDMDHMSAFLYNLIVDVKKVYR